MEEITTPVGSQANFEFVGRMMRHLVIVHGMALVSCLALLREYDSTPSLKGIGTPIASFGLGLLSAVLAFGFNRAIYRSRMTRLLAGEPVAVDVTVELRSSVQGLLLLFSGVTSLVLLILAVLWGVRHFWGHL